MRRPIYVRQNENSSNGRTQYWYTVSRGNGQTTLTSETYTDRSGAIRAARGTIDLLCREMPVTFSYWAGRVGSAEMRTETIR